MKEYEISAKKKVPQSISIVKFYQMNGIVYSQFENWYKIIFKSNPIPMDIVNVPEEYVAIEKKKMEDKIGGAIKSDTNFMVSRIDIKFNNGLRE